MDGEEGPSSIEVRSFKDKIIISSGDFGTVRSAKDGDVESRGQYVAAI